MFTYQTRPRVLRIAPGQRLVFPSRGQVHFHFSPAQPFGSEIGGGQTAVAAEKLDVTFNANSGKLEFRSSLMPLSVGITSGSSEVVLDGTSLTVNRDFESLEHLTALIHNVYFVFPTVLNLPFADPPFITSVDGSIGETSFRWELFQWEYRVRATSQDHQEMAVATAWKRFLTLAMQEQTRVIAALHYFHVACRLARAGSMPGEFVAEVILNLSKCLEAIFPPRSGVQSIDAVRAGLKSVGYADSIIERDFVPAVALRNHIDVGHVEIGFFETDALRTIHAYTERAESAFRDLLERIFSGLESGAVGITSHVAGPACADALKVVERMRKAEADSDSSQIVAADGGPKR